MATTTSIPSSKISGGSFLLETRRPEEIFTPEDFTEQHQLIGQTAEEFAVNEILPNAEKIEHKDFSVSRELLKKAGELGLSGVEIPEAYGGLEMDKVTAAVIADHIAKYAGFAPPGARTAASACCRLFISARRSRRTNICRGSRPGRW
jgi:alkylation response protein AidB-like acyl-CoA dehydrogenase